MPRKSLNLYTPHAGAFGFPNLVDHRLLRARTRDKHGLLIHKAMGLVFNTLSRPIYLGNSNYYAWLGEAHTCLVRLLG